MAVLEISRAPALSARPLKLACSR